MKQKFLLVDGNFLLFQSFWASYSLNGKNNLMHSKDGTTTNGVHVFLMTLHKLIQFINPNLIFIAFDSKEKTKRHQLFSDYKSGRITPPKEIFEQFDLIKKILTNMNLHWAEKPGDEADDLIATMSNSFENVENYIFSKDKDLLQLVNENTSIVKIVRSSFNTSFELVDLTNFSVLYGILPKQIPDFKGLAGDSSDNLKGVPGIGEKKAISLLNEFQTLDGIYNNLDKIKGKLKENLIAGKEQGFFCKDLALLNKNVLLDKNINNYVFSLDNFNGPNILNEYGLNVVKNKFFN